MATININRPLTGSQKLNKINKDLEEREKKKKKVYGQTRDVIVSAEGKKVDYSKQTEDPLNLKNKKQQNNKTKKKTTVEDTLNKQKSIQLKQQQKQKQNYGKTGISKQVKEDYERGYHVADSNAMMQNYANKTGSYDTKDYARDIYGIGKKSTLEKAGKTAKDIITNPKKALNSIPVALADVSKGAIGTMENWWETLREWDYEINDKFQNKLGLISDEELKNRRYQMEEDKKYDFTENLWRNLGWDEQNERILNENSYLTGSNKGDQLFQTVGSQLPAVAIASYFGDTRGGAEALKNSLTSLKGKQGLDLAKTALGNVGKAALMNAPSNVEIGLRSYGAASTQALKEGATYEQARRYGLASAATEIATEWVTGGIPGVESSTGWLSNAADKLIDSSTGKIKNRYVKKLAKSLLDYGFNSAGEGFEEALSEIVDPIIKNAIYTDGEKIDWDKVVESAIMGAASAGILEIPGHLSGLKNDIQAIRGRDTVINQAQQMSDFQVQQIQEAVQSGQVSPIEGQQAVQFIQQRLEQVVQQANEMYAQQTGEIDNLEAQRSYKLNENQQGNINTQEQQNVPQNANNEVVQNTTTNKTENKNIKNIDNKPTTINKEAYNSEPKEGTIRLYTNTSAENIDSILQNGLDVNKAKQNEYEGNMTWFETRPDLKGYGGTTIAVDVPSNLSMDKVNDTQYTVYDNISPENIAFIDKPVMNNYRTSDMEELLNKYGEEKVTQVFDRALENGKASISKEEFNNLINSIKQENNQQNINNVEKTTQQTNISKQSEAFNLGKNENVETQTKPKGKAMSLQEISDKLGVKNKTSEVENVTKNEIKNQTEAFNLGENKEKLPINTKDKLQNFKNSLKNENITDVDGFYKAVEKIIKDKDYNVIADSSIKNKDGKAVDALISNENGITIKINPKSKRAAEILLMHEVTHGIETKAISDLIVDYASKNSEFNKALESLKRAYGTEDVTSEVVADISGQLFGNQEFINNLSTKEPGLFRKIYNKIVEVANKLTGNSKQALFMRDLKNKWEKAYRDANLESSQQTLKDAIKYSNNFEITDNQGRPLDIDQQNFFENSQVVDDEGNLITLYHTNKYFDYPFYEFKPQVADDYHNDMFGDNTVIFLTNSKEMSGSYADDNYIAADTKRYTKEEINNFLDVLNSNGRTRNYDWKLKDLTKENNYEYYKNYERDKYLENWKRGWEGNETPEQKIEIAKERGLLTDEEYENYTKPNKYAIINGNNENNMILFKSEDDLLKNWKNKLSRNINENSDTTVNMGKYQYEVYANITNPYIVEANGNNWDAITREINEDRQKAFKELSRKDKKYLSEVAEKSFDEYGDYISSGKAEKYSDYNYIFESLSKQTKDNFIGLYTNLQVNNLEYTAEAYEKYQKENGGTSPNYEIRSFDDTVNMRLADFFEEWCKLEDEHSKYASEEHTFFMNLYNSENIDKYMDAMSKLGFLDEEQFGTDESRLFYMAKYGFPDWAINDALTDKMSTNDVVAKVLKMNKNGSNYDGVIIKDTVDYGGLAEEYEPNDVYIAFNSNQIKSVDNKHPTKDPDIRYSEKAKKWREFVEKNFKNEGTTTRLDEKINNENVTEKEKTSVDYTQEQLDALLNKISEAKEKELKAQMSKKDSKNFDTTKEILKDFKSAKDGEFNNKKLRKYVKTSNDATGMQKSIEQADLDKITYSVKENKTTYEEARNNIKDLSYDERKTRSKNKLNSRDRVTATDIVETQMTMLEAAKKGDIQTYLDLQQDVAIMATEYGQTIQALSMIQKMSPEGQIETLMKIINRKQKLGNKTWKNVELNPNLVKKVLDSYDDETHTTYNQELMEQAVDELKQDLANQMKVSWAEKANEWRYLSMLGNPKTHVRNMIGNVAMSLVKLGKDVTSAAGQDVASKLGLIDKSSKTTTLKLASKDVRNLAKQSFEEMTALEGKNSKYNESSSIEQQRKIFKSKVAEGARKLNLDWLEKEDKIFKNLNFRRSFSKYLTAQGITTQADIKANPQIVADAKAFAMNEAKIATFQQQNKAAKWIRDLDKLGPVAEVVRGSIIPFTTVPMNIAETGLEYAPTGLFKTIADTRKAPKGQKGVVFIDGISKQIIGGSLAILGYALAKKGILKADAGDDNEDKFLKDIGAKMDYSIKLGDTSYDLSWLSPSAMPFFVGAAFYEQLEKGQGIDGNFLTEALASTLDPLSEMSVISSLTEIFDSYEKNKAKRIANAGEKALQNYITQYIPTAFSQFARTLDDKKRSTYADKNSPWTFGQETLRKVAYKIPGVRTLLPEQKDYLGRTKEENKNIALRALESLVSPMNYKKDTSNEVTKELVRLYDETGGSGLIPTKPDQYIKYKNGKYEMTQKEYNDFKKDYGENAFTEVNKALKDKDYQNLSDSQKAAVIKNIMGYSKYKAKYDYFEDRDIDYYNQTYNKARKSEENGHAIYDYYISKKASKNNSSTTSNTKEKTDRYAEVAKKGIDAKTFDDFKNFVNNTRGDSRRGGKTKKQKVQEYIQSLNLTAKQKQDLYNDYLNNSGYISYYK